MNQEEVKALLVEGIKDFKKGLPIPENRARAIGWRHAKFVATQLELYALANSG